ncbi:MAG: hypothetical protein KDA59_04260, partial [Planctomycetales bacterium]|nr:hypothetical protein [Planctomycetales bacterium]
YTISATVTDDDSLSGSGSTSVVVQNLSPTITSAASDHDDPCESSSDGIVTISGSFADVGTLDTHTVQVDWGDGSPIESLPAGSVDQSGDGFLHSHTYGSGGIFEVTITVVDDDNGQSDAQTVLAVVQGIGLVDGTLYVIGTDGKDIVNVHQTGSRWNPWIKVTANLDVRGGSDGGSDGGHDRGRRNGNGGSDGGSDGGRDRGRGHSDGGNDRGTEIAYFRPWEIEQIEVYLCADDDHATIGGGSDGGSDGWSDGGSDGGLDIPALIYGGDGRDHLTGGSAADTLFGGDGDDKLKGRGGNDVLIGGAGNDDLWGGDGDDVLSGGDGDDSLWGDRGDDILIGGLGRDDLKAGHEDDLLITMRWTEEENRAALAAIHSEWNRGDASYDQKREHLVGASAGGLNGSFLLNRSTLVEDNDRDTLRGEKGRDLFFATLGGSKKDNVKDDKRDEDVLTIDDLP